LFSFLFSVDMGEEEEENSWPVVVSTCPVDAPGNRLVADGGEDGNAAAINGNEGEARAMAAFVTVR
jgi:hypothetical protein